MAYTSDKIIGIINEMNSWVEGFMFGARLDDAKHPEVFNSVNDALSEFESIIRAKENSKTL